MKTEYLLKREADLVMAALTPVNRCVVKVCLHTGLRVSDVLSLRTDQLATVMSVTEKKTKKRRRVGLTADLLDEVREHAGPVWAFPGRFGTRPQSRQAVWKDVKRAAKAFRMPQNIAPHSFRKLYAADLMERYGDIERVQRALKHSSPTVTLIYAMSDKQLEARLSKRKKRGRP